MKAECGDVFGDGLGAAGVDLFGGENLFFGAGNPGNGCSMLDLSNCAEHESDREILQGILAENRFGFTAADALFQSINDYELLKNGQDPTTIDYKARPGPGGIQIFIVGGCVAFRDALGNWYNWGCSGGDWISVQQLADAFRNLSNAILSARQNPGRSSNDIKIQNLANEITYEVDHPMTLCEFGDFAALSFSIAVYPEIAFPRWVTVTVWAGTGAWGIKQYLTGGCHD